jgi:hypothetical protein
MASEQNRRYYYEQRMKLSDVETEQHEAISGNRTHKTQAI